MNKAEKVLSAQKILTDVVKARWQLESALETLALTNAAVALDPSGEPSEIEGIISSLEEVTSKVALEVYRWDTYLDNRE